MRISPNKIVLINPTISNTAAGRTRTVNGVENTPKAPESKFDTVTIEAENSFQKQLQSKISQEIRTATTTGTISGLREQVQSGQYQVDAQNIARRLLFFGEV